VNRHVIEPGTAPGPRDHGPWIRLSWDQAEVTLKALKDVVLQPVIRRGQEYTIHEVDDLADAITELQQVLALRPPD
jgi:hypothetical protein